MFLPKNSYCQLVNYYPIIYMSSIPIYGEGIALSYLPIKDDPFDAQANIKWQFTVQKKQMDTANKTWCELNETDKCGMFLRKKLTSPHL